MFYSAADLLWARDAENLHLPCWRGATESPIDLTTEKFLGQVYVLECYRPAAEMLQNCSRDSADLLFPCCTCAAEPPIDATYQILSL